MPQEFHIISRSGASSGKEQAEIICMRKEEEKKSISLLSFAALFFNWSLLPLLYLNYLFFGHSKKWRSIRPSFCQSTLFTIGNTTLYGRGKMESRMQIRVLLQFLLLAKGRLGIWRCVCAVLVCSPFLLSCLLLCVSQPCVWLCHGRLPLNQRLLLLLISLAFDRNYFARRHLYSLTSFCLLVDVYKVHSFLRKRSKTVRLLCH